MRPALAAEWLKLRRSRLPVVTLAAATIGVAAGTLFMFIGAHPDRARELGVLGAKAQIAGLDPTWPGHLALLAQIAAIGGLGIFGMSMVWIFGREFADHTAKDLLALPTSRTATVAAKYLVATAWSLAVTSYLAAGGLVAGVALQLPQWSTGNAVHGLLRLAVTASLTIALTATIGLAASAGRGYIPGVLTMFAMLFTAQIVAALGYGHWYPYSVPAVYSGVAGPDQPAATPAGYAAIAAVAVVCVAATIRWWNHADHTH